MSDDKSQENKPQQNTSTSSNGSTSSQTHQDEDLFSTVRRFADEQISAALHSVFGIPSILQTPSSSNWIIEETDRNNNNPNNRLDDMSSRREGADDESRNSSGEDNEGNGPSGPGISGFGGDSGSSGSSGSSPSSGSSNSRDRNEDNEFRPPALWTPSISQLLLSLGLHSTAILERNFGHFHKEFQRLLEQESASHKAVAEASESDQEKNTPTSETIIIKGSQRDDEEPKFTVTRYTGQPPSSIWKELFGEDMYGSQRTHPLFTSFFDEFLPDGQYNRQHPPRPVGGWSLFGEPTVFPSMFPTDSFESLFRMMVGPTLRRLEESSDPKHNDEMRREVDRMFQELAEGKLRPFRIQEEVEKAQEEREREFVQRLKERREEIARLMRIREAIDTRAAETGKQVVKMEEKAMVPVDVPRSEEKREPETELDLHNYFASSGQKKGEERVVVSQSTSTTSTTDSNGVTKTKRVRERRYSDGSVEREEHNEETKAQQRTEPLITEGWGGWGEYGLPRGIGARTEEMRRAFAEERRRDEASHPSAVSTASQTEENGQKGGWGSWLWASGKK
ncbi:hypothetical protein ABW19_dt0205699 [Dactylella cylindrospora]|nr:hypothetical protein ABW19_dt0205699 [Dactylella cylindrospora]